MFGLRRIPRLIYFMTLPRLMMSPRMMEILRPPLVGKGKAEII